MGSGSRFKISGIQGMGRKLPSTVKLAIAEAYDNISKLLAQEVGQRLVIEKMKKGR